uniref:Photosystem II protein T n=3 Tax=Chromera velia TaxID=505693 RepID=D9IXF9_9ALVE|nr:photosystem II protein T [Chromera velia]ADJ66567.1 photosystem II protein T [Chromera velia]
METIVYCTLLFGTLIVLISAVLFRETPVIPQIEYEDEEL